jgi:phosphoribosylaminoimidazole-succinocarboxamide synthase
VPDPNVTIARECRPLPVEIIVRAYLTGVTSTSIWKLYEAGQRTFGGLTLPEGLRKNEPLPSLVITPTTKAHDGGHDEPITREELARRGLVDAETFDRIETLALSLFRFGQAEVQRRGLILVDTKYELGFDSEGRLTFIDEIHTPDSSRYWHADDYEARLLAGEEPRSLDKEYVRRYYAGLGYRGEGAPPPMPDEVRLEAARRYIAAFERVTGTTFSPDPHDPIPRIRTNLGLTT